MLYSALTMTLCARLSLEEVSAQMKKLILFVGVILLCIGTAAGLFLFLISLPGGPGTQGQIDWIEIFTSPAPAYLPWKIFTITCILGFILTMVGLIAKSRK
jgi:hypothetical protein